MRKLLKLGDFLFGGLAARAGVRVVGIYLERIGEIGHALDVYVKMGELGWRPRYHSFVVAPPRRVSNPTYLEYWRPYVHVISSPLAATLLEHATFSRHLHFLPPGPYRGLDHWHREDASVAIGAEWERQGRGPLLRLTQRHASCGRTALAELGVPHDAWFVALHVREPGYLGENEASHRWHRNARVETYLPAVQMIVERGGWVVRLGDPTMTPLPSMERVVDYPFLAMRSDWLDVYLAADCRFLLGTTSGMFMVAHTFGRPFAGTNWVPFSAIPRSENDVYLPKLYRSVADARLLSFAEMLAPELHHIDDSRRLAELGLEVVDNSEEEIRQLTVEVLDRLEGRAEYTEEDERLQERYRSVFTRYAGDVRCRAGRDFLREYAYLLPTM